MVAGEEQARNGDEKKTGTVAADKKAIVTTELRVADIVVGNRIRTENRHQGALTNSIRELGLLHPVVVNKRHELVAGFRRLTAAKALGWETVPVRVVETLDDALLALKAEQAENVCREPLTPSEIVEVGRKIESLEKPEAARRREATQSKPGQQVGNAGKLGSGNFPEPDKGQTRDKVGAAVGVSGKTYEKAKAVVDQGVPELTELMDDKTLSVDLASKIAQLPEKNSGILQPPTTRERRQRKPLPSRKTHRPAMPSRSANTTGSRTRPARSTNCSPRLPPRPPQSHGP